MESHRAPNCATLKSMTSVSLEGVTIVAHGVINPIFVENTITLLSPRSFHPTVCTGPALAIKAVCVMKTIQLVGGEIISYPARV